MPLLGGSSIERGTTKALSKLQVRITRLSGEPLCTLLVDTCCTVDALKYGIQLETDIPFSRQRLVCGNDVTPLEHERCVKDLADETACVTLALIQTQKPPLQESDFSVNATSLRDAISSSDADESLQLLTFSSLPGLNTADADGSSVLHLGAWYGLTDVCQAILDRSDFIMADALDQNGFTALHCATLRGNQDVARLLLMSTTFTSVESCYAQFNPHDAGGWSAYQLAVLNGNTAISEMIIAFKKGKFR